MFHDSSFAFKESIYILFYQYSKRWWVSSGREMAPLFHSSSSTFRTVLQHILSICSINLSEHLCDHRYCSKNIRFHFLLNSIILASVYTRKYRHVPFKSSICCISLSSMFPFHCLFLLEVYYIPSCTSYFCIKMLLFLFISLYFFKNFVHNSFFIIFIFMESI